MFKAKVLSLYFPKVYLNVCSEGSLTELADALGIPEQRYNSRLQYELRQAKQSHQVSADWSNVKFMQFLFASHYDYKTEPPPAPIRKPAIRRHPIVDLEKIQRLRGKVGRRSERFALRHERKRLGLAGLGHLVGRIEDLTKHPSYGYDFKSFSAEGRPRYIEVKTAGKDRATGKEYRIYLSENERVVSLSESHANDYYFYLVFNGSDGRPVDVVKLRATALYGNSDQQPCVYIQRFIRDDLSDG